MSSSRKVFVLGVLALVVIVATTVWADFAVFTPHIHVHAVAPTALPYNATANGPYTVQGNKILGVDGKQYIFHGVARDSLEYNCVGDQFFDQQHLAYMGSGTNTATATYWGSNTVRLPLSEGFWLYGDVAAPGSPAPPVACSSSQYQSLVKRVVDTLTALKLNVILDLQWTDAIGTNGTLQSLRGGGPWSMPDDDSVKFWQQVAPLYESYTNVLFEVYNEPHPSGYPAASAWSCWATGCTVTKDNSYSADCNCMKTLSSAYKGVSMQALVNAVRHTGANNIVLVGGLNWGYDLSQIGNASYALSGSNIVYDTHPYSSYTDKAPNTWDVSFGNASATYPVLSSENGEYDCGSSYVSQLLPYFDAHQIGWVAWAWVVSNDQCGYPQLVSDYQGTPASLNQAATYIYQYLRSYAPFTSPVSKTWYFAEGRVGASFKEYLTLENPDPVHTCTATIQYLLEGGSPVTKSVTITPATRLTESVNADLNVAYNQTTGVSVSTIVTVDSGSMCQGIVVERPMYFSWHGINSGSDVVGATSLGQNFYFADVPTGSGYASFLTVLNPPGNQPATVTATYYLGGHAVGSSQSVTVQPGTRGTISPNAAGLPMHVAAIVTASQPVVVERPDYFGKINAGNAQTVSGAASVVGAQALANDWLFAEGYTGGKFQEYLVIANLDTKANTTANVTITLQGSSGATQTVPLAVNALDQVVWNVNQHTAPGPVSVEVASTGAQIVVERQLFFQYSHTLSQSNGFQVSTAGGTDVIGQAGPASFASYTFAEGYNNKGYNEWLTVQNPTSNDEALSVTMINGYGRVYVPTGIVVHAHSRYTMDVTSLVLQYLVQPGDDHRGYEVSLSVQTSGTGAFFVAERPMYWNTGSGGTSGGSDVIGYSH